MWQSQRRRERINTCRNSIALNFSLFFFLVRNQSESDSVDSTKLNSIETDFEMIKTIASQSSQIGEQNAVCIIDFNQILKSQSSISYKCAHRQFSDWHLALRLALLSSSHDSKGFNALLVYSAVPVANCDFPRDDENPLLASPKWFDGAADSSWHWPFHQSQMKPIRIGRISEKAGNISFHLWIDVWKINRRENGLGQTCEVSNRKFD